MQSCIEATRALLDAAEVDGLLVSGRANRRYLSGFTGSAGFLLVSHTAALLITDVRYVEQAVRESAEFGVRRLVRSLAPLLPELLAEAGVRRLGFEAQYLTVAALQELEPAVQGIGATVVPTEGLVEGLRIRKTAGELRVIEDAIAVADLAFEHGRRLLRAGITERALAWEIERCMREHGAGSISFPLIVAAGAQAALPHHQPSDRPIEPGEPVVIDIGARVRGYCSDMTRTLCIGEPDARFREIYAIVLAAQEQAEGELCPGMTAEEVDAIARSAIADAGYGEAFGHSLGHGIGLAVHEAPWVRSGSTDVLEPGMVFSLEPGIYLPDWGGIRIEDLVLMTDDGARVLTRAPKLDELRRSQ